MENINKEKLQKHFLFEQKLHERLRTQEGVSKIAKYFNSSPTKHYLANLLGQAALGLYNLNCVEFAEKISASKSGTCSIINDCVEEGWVVMYKHGGKTCYKASDEMMKLYENYFHLKEKWSVEVFKNGLQLYGS